MEQLSGLDTAFLYLESPTTHLHVGLVAVFDASEVPVGTGHDRVARLLEERLHLIPPFRRRLRAPLGGLLPAVWVDDDVSVEDHIVRVPVLADLGDGALAAYAGDVMRRPLDRRRPLWELHVLEGRDDRRLAIVAKVHHAAVDGVSGVELLGNLVDASPEGRDVTPPPPRQASPPATEELVRSAVDAVVTGPARTLVALQRTASRLGATRPGVVGDDGTDPGAAGHRHGAAGWRAPRTSLTRPVTDRRSVALTALPMDDVEAVRKVAGGTLNDVVLAICAGALRRYLELQGEKPDAPLVAGVPVSLRTGDPTAVGNRLSIAFVPMATDVEDVRARYGAIVAASQAAKRRESVVPVGELVAGWLGLIQPRLGMQLGRLVTGLTSRVAPPMPLNVVVSNIPGPPFALYAAGMRMTAVHPMGPIIDAVPLNITVLSYCDLLEVGLVACPHAVPDLDVVVGLLHDSLHEVRAAWD